jgi:hypothetical protein
MLTFKELYNTFGIGGFKEHKEIYKDILKQHFQQLLKNPKEGNHVYAEKNILGGHVYILFLVFVLRIGSRIR